MMTEYDCMLTYNLSYLNCVGMFVHVWEHACVRACPCVFTCAGLWVFIKYAVHYCSNVFK